MELQKTVGKAAEIIKKHDYAKVVSHYDADGITSGGIICNALLRRGIQFHATIVSKLEESFIQDLDEELIIFCDMGTSQIDLISNHLKEKDVIILDHHVPPTPNNETLSSLPASLIHINSYCLRGEGEEGEIGEVCAAGITYLLARALGSEESGGDNKDLAGLAVAGALGDKQEMNRGINKLILDEAINKGVISVKKGLKLGEGNIKDLLLFSTDPYIEIVGEEERVDALLNDLGINGKSSFSDLEKEKQKSLIVALLSLMKGSKENVSVDDLVGTIYILKSEVVRNSIEFMRLVDVSGRMGKSGIGLGLCMKEEKMIEVAQSLYMRFQSRIISELKRIKEKGNENENIREASNVFYFYVQEKGITGVLAGIIAKYLFTNKPIILLNKKEGAETKISARCNKKTLLTEGIDLARATEESSREVGGFGGGHPVASGGSIPEGKEEEFIASIDRIIGFQKKKEG